ncbi:cyclophilin-like fold protein [Candidatus Nitrosotenuis aquarius]|uniref:cyclophilin-like fold protein n=1 Tax=Candidatus Nitrosotenuis aquarius TaxID=1846278 RepID=UPI001FE2884F|nr:cyclophilin-like fold protein [Candidatus Nitrosotenuis aquarius]
MSAGTVSTTRMILEIRGKSKLDCELKRHLSPKTVGIIMRSLPLDGNAHFMGQNIVYFETKVNSGIERQKKEFKKGDIAFTPAGSSICLFVSDVVTSKPLTPIGKILTNVDALKDVTSGDVISLYLG